MAPQQKSKSYKESNADEYTAFFLSIYDFFVLKFIATFFWRCPTSKFTLPLFRANASARHIDISIGTRYHPASHPFPRASELTLCDLNTRCLDTAEARLKRPDMKCSTLQHDILEPLPASIEKFDSISMMYLLHCLPGPQHRKTAVFSHIKHSLAPGGTFFGATVLGNRRCHTTMSYWWLKKLNEDPLWIIWMTLRLNLQTLFAKTFMRLRSAS